MEFLYPTYLFGLAAVAIPVIIHLFNFRKFKKVYFSNTRFLEEIHEKTQKQSELKHLIILFLRIFAVVSIVLAFARPFIPADKADINQAKSTYVSIYLDNSFSMMAENSRGDILQNARIKAEEIMDAYPYSTSFNLLTNDFKGVNQRFSSKDKILETIEEIEFSSALRTMSEVVSRQTDLFSRYPDANHIYYFISDFQETMCDIKDVQFDSLAQLFFIPLGGNTPENLYIDSLWLTSPILQVNRPMQLKVRIVNHAEKDYEKIPANLFINDEQKALASFDIGKDGRVVIDMPFTMKKAGMHKAFVEIEDSPVTHDDRFYFSFAIKENIPVLSIYEKEGNTYLKFVYEDSAFIYHASQSEKLNYAAFQSYDLIILDALQTIPSGLSQELSKFLERGGSLVLSPSESAELETYNAFLELNTTLAYRKADTLRTAFNYLNYDHLVFDGLLDVVPDKMSNLDLPEVFMHYPVESTDFSDLDKLIVLENGNVFFCQVPVEAGKLYLFASSLTPESTGFPRHALFLPVFYNLAILSKPPMNLFYEIGNAGSISINQRINSNEEVLKIVDEKKSLEFIPEQRRIDYRTDVFLHSNIKEAGNYDIMHNDNRIQFLSLNYNRRESILNMLDKEQLRDALQKAKIGNYHILDNTIKEVGEAIQAINQGVQLWRYFIIAALFFLLMEVILLRFWR